jgi:hypothetical protein
MTTMASFEQAGYAFYEDGSEAGSAIIGSIDTQQTLDTSTTYLARILVQNVAAGSGNYGGAWEYSTTGTSGTWVPITTTSSVIIAVASTPLTETDTTQRVGSGTFITSNAWVTETGPFGNLGFTSVDECETLLSFQIVDADVSDNQEIHLRVDGMDAYQTDKWPDIDVNKAAAEGRRRSNVT